MSEVLAERRVDVSARQALIRARDHLLGLQDPAGWWKGELETNVALRLAGDPPEAAHMRAAAGFVLDRGGLERARVFTHMWLALFGLWPWDEVPALPPEVIFLPEWFPLNVYDFACWARQTIVALTVVGAYRPVRPLRFGIDELRTGITP